jgi:hypothetical protein
MSPDTKNDDLLYVADAGTNNVYLYSWPANKLKGTLTYPTPPQASCSPNFVKAPERLRTSR